MLLPLQHALHNMHCISMVEILSLFLSPYFCRLQSGILSIVENSSLSCRETFCFVPHFVIVSLTWKGKDKGDNEVDDDDYEIMCVWKIKWWEEWLKLRSHLLVTSNWMHLSYIKMMNRNQFGWEEWWWLWWWCCMVRRWSRVQHLWWYRLKKLLIHLIGMTSITPLINLENYAKISLT